MMIHKIATSVDRNYWWKRLDTQLNDPNNQNSLKVLKVVKPMNKKTLLKILGTSLVNSLLSPLSIPVCTTDQRIF